MSDDPNESNKPSESEQPSSAERDSEVLRHRVASLLNELRAIFRPEMVLTFIARDPNDAERYSVITEEKDKDSLADFIRASKPFQDLGISKNENKTRN